MNLPPNLGFHQKNLAIKPDPGWKKSLASEKNCGTRHADRGSQMPGSCVERGLEEQTVAEIDLLLELQALSC